MKMFQISDKLGEVSRIGIGCMRITGLPDEKAVRALIEGSMELGINFFDHADIYAGGEAESSIWQCPDTGTERKNGNPDEMRDSSGDLL